MIHYDHIPAGMKPKLDPATGEYKLVPLEADNVEDLKVMLDERDATIKELESKLKNLEVQLQKHQDSKKKV